MKLKVVFGIDPTGAEKDIVEEIEIPSNTCLYCHIDGNNLRIEVKKALENKGYNLDNYFGLLKIYTL